MTMTNDYIERERLRLETEERARREREAKEQAAREEAQRQKAIQEAAERARLEALRLQEARDAAAKAQQEAALKTAQQAGQYQQTIQQAQQQAAKLQQQQEREKRQYEFSQLPKNVPVMPTPPADSGLPTTLSGLPTKLPAGAVPVVGTLAGVETRDLINDIMQKYGVTEQEALRTIQHILTNPYGDIWTGDALLNRHPELLRMIIERYPGAVYKQMMMSGKIPVVVDGKVIFYPPKVIKELEKRDELVRIGKDEPKQSGYISRKYYDKIKAFNPRMAEYLELYGWGVYRETFKRYLKDNFENNPIELKGMYNARIRKGFDEIDALKGAMSDYEAYTGRLSSMQVRNEQRAEKEFKKQVASPDYPEELRQSYINDSREVFNDKVRMYNMRIEREKLNLETPKQTSDPKDIASYKTLFAYKESGKIVTSYDLAKYLRDNEKDAGAEKRIVSMFDRRDIDAAKKYNYETRGVGAPVFKTRSEFIGEYFSKNKWPLFSKEKDKPMSSMGTALDQERLKEANQMYDRIYTAPMTYGQFQTYYFQDRGWDNELPLYPENKRGLIVTRQEAEAELKAREIWFKRRDEALKAYTSKFGTYTVVAQASENAANMILPGYYLAKNWTGLSNTERVVNIAIDVIFVATMFKFPKGVLHTASNMLKKTSFNTLKAINNVTERIDTAIKYNDAAALRREGNRLLDIGTKMKAQNILGSEAVIKNGNNLINRATNIINVRYIPTYKLQDSVKNLLSKSKQMLKGQAGYVETPTRPVEPVKTPDEPRPDWLPDEPVKTPEEPRPDWLPEEPKPVPESPGPDWLPEKKPRGPEPTRPMPEPFEPPKTKPVEPKPPKPEKAPWAPPDRPWSPRTPPPIEPYKPSEPVKIPGVPERYPGWEPKPDWDVPFEPEKKPEEEPEEPEKEPEINPDEEPVIVPVPEKVPGEEPEKEPEINPDEEPVIVPVPEKVPGEDPLKEPETIPDQEPKPVEIPSPDDEPSTQPKPSTQPQPETQPLPGTQPLPKTKPLPVTQPSPETKPQPGTQPLPKTKPLPVTQPSPETKPQPGTKPLPTTKPLPGTKPIPGTKTKPSTKPKKDTDNKPFLAPRLGTKTKYQEATKPFEKISIKPKMSEAVKEPLPFPSALVIPRPVPFDGIKTPPYEPEPPKPPPYEPEPPKPPPPPPPKDGRKKKFVTKPDKDAPDKKKKEFLDQVEGVVARRRGMLNGKPLYLIDYYPYGPKDKMVMFTRPNGVKEASGKGSVKASATLIRGIPPSKAIYSDTGAVDDIITAKGDGIEVKHVRDKENRRMKRIMKPVKMVDGGNGIVFNPKTGRGHLKIRG